MSARRRIGLTIAVLPGVALVALFYSLAIHMHHALGGWPTSIGALATGLGTNTIEELEHWLHNVTDTPAPTGACGAVSL